MDEETVFINEILGEMSSQFNKAIQQEIRQSIRQDMNDSGLEISPKHEQEHIKLEEFENFEKIMQNSSTQNLEELNDVHHELALENTETGCSSILNKSPNNENCIKNTASSLEITNKDYVSEKIQNSRAVLKRSSRRRPAENSESILQSAIARKEKSFGEYCKPQRLTRQVKSGHKINEISSESKNDSSKNPSLRKTLQSTNKNQNAKKFKASHSDSEKETDEKLSQENELTLRRSQRTNSSKEILNKSSDHDKNIDDLGKCPSTEPSCSLDSAQRINSRLCLCMENKKIFMKEDTESESHFCTAIDAIGNKLIGCSRLINFKTTPMLRPSHRVPFGVFCDAHRNRLIRHNCCPACGVFCTQGHFIECKSKHHYHKDCKLSVGDLECCPHCGDFSQSTDIVISMHSSKKPIFLPVQKSRQPGVKTSVNQQQYFDIHTITNRRILKCLLSRSTPAKMSFDTNIDNTLCSTPPIIPLDRLQVLGQDEIVLNGCDEHDLIEAIDSEDLRMVASILESGDVNLATKLSDKNNGSFLHLATRNGNISIVYLLVISRIDLDVLDKEQNTALMIAIMENKNEIVKYLVKAGADLTLKGTDGMTALHIAAKCGNLESCKILLSSSFGIYNFVNAQDDGGWTPLVWACEHGYIHVAKFLVSKGADINLRDVEHNVALHWAAFSGSTEIVEILLNWKCNVNVLNVHGDTPLHISAREDQYNCVIIFLARGANVSLVNKNNETPLDCVPKGGKCYDPLALNVQLLSVVSVYCDKQKCLWSNDISRGRELNPIQCYNFIDNEKEPKDYVYIKKNCISSDTIKIDYKVSTVQSCSCEDRCMSSNCDCGKMSLKCWYDEDGKLSTEFNFSDSPLIFECNEMCSCNSILCLNRVVQKQITQRFQLFKTNSKGWGIKTLNFIAKGNYVCEYIGEILTDIEADHREDDSYLFDLDNRDTDSFCIDAKYYGNFARFINHSCDPNLHSVKVFIDHHDLKFPRIALFAKRNIQAEEELSFDYGDKFWLIKYKSFTCDCRTAHCKYSEDNIGETLQKYQTNM